MSLRDVARASAAGAFNLRYGQNGREDGVLRLFSVGTFWTCGTMSLREGRAWKRGGCFQPALRPKRERLRSPLPSFPWVRAGHAEACPSERVAISACLVFWTCGSLFLPGARLKAAHCYVSLIS